MPKAKAPKKKANPRKEHAAFAALKAHTDSEKAAVLKVARNAYDAIGPLDFQSSTQRVSLRDHLRGCVRDLPKSIPRGDHDRLVQGLYELVRDLRKTWGTRETKDKTTVQTPETPQKPAVIEFDFSRHTVLPNIDIQVFRAGAPGGVLTYRLSDFLDEQRPGARSSDGDWIDGTLLFADALIAELKKMNYMKSDSETLWWNPLPQHEVDTITQGANVAGEDEILMTEMNFHSSLRRLIDSHLPNLRLNPESRGKLDMVDLGPPISLVIRPEDTTGKSMIYDSSIYVAYAE